MIIIRADMTKNIMAASNNMQCPRLNRGISERHPDCHWTVFRFIYKIWMLVDPYSIPPLRAYRIFQFAWVCNSAGIYLSHSGKQGKIFHVSLFSFRQIHWSPANKSSRIRTVIQLKLIPQEANLAAHYRPNEQELLKYTISEESYRVHAPSRVKPDDLEFIGKLNQQHVIYNNKQFISKMKEINPDNAWQKRNLFQRLFNWECQSW